MANSEDNMSGGESNNKSKDKENQQILGIQAIKSIVEIAETASSVTKIIDLIVKISKVYRYLPESWKRKAKQYLDMLWKKRKVIVSTDPEKPKEIYGVSFENSRLDKLYSFLPKSDQAIMVQGKSMLDQINKSLHTKSEEIKKDVGERYGRRGLNIVDMITTNDIKYMLEEIKEPFTAKNCEMIFNDWALNYNHTALLISPSELDVPKEVQRKIIEISEKTVKDYVLLNMSGTEENCNKLLKIVLKLGKEKKLKYAKETHSMYDSGFRKSLKIILLFKDTK